MDWSKIDNEKLFQRLVNDLFALEVGRPGYKPSSPYIGADGGWDGRFNDEYLGLSGESCVQSKWTGKDLSEAYEAVRSSMLGDKGELEKAKTNKVKNLFIVTNARLKVGADDHIGKLEQLKGDFVEQLFIYDREKLELLISKYPLLLHKYFGKPQKPLFVPYADYTEIEREMFIDSPLLGRRPEIEAVKDFLSDNSKKILIMYAPQGYGKSRFLLEMAPLLQEEVGTRWESWFCRPSLRNVEDAIQDEILPGKKYLLILDNANLTEEQTKKLITASKSLPASEIKLVLTCRTPDKDTVVDWVTGLRISEYSLLGLSRLSDDLLVQLHTSASNGKQFTNREKIIKELDGNPFYIITHAKKLSSSGDTGDLKNKIAGDLQEAAEKCLKELSYSKDQVNALLREIAASVPFKLNHAEILAQFAKVIGKTESEIQTAIEKMITCGLLRYVGSSVRFSTDINGNIYLAKSLDGDSGTKIAEEMFARWLPIIPDRFSSNIGTAGFLSDTSNLSGVVNKTLRRMVLDSASADVDKKVANLSIAKYFVFLATGACIDLVSTYLAAQSSPKEINRDTYGPVIAGLIDVPKYKKPVLELIQTIATKDIPGTYNNYDPKTLISSSVSPIELRGLDAAIDSLNVLDEWSQTVVDSPTIDLIIAGVEEALSGSHQYRESEGITLTIGRKSLIFSPKVAEYRDVAMKIYKQLLIAKDPAIQVKAVEAFNQIGNESYGKDGDLWERIIADKNEAMSVLEQIVVAPNSNYNVLAEIEDELIKLWANNEIYGDLSKRAEKVLESLNRTTEYLAHKLFSGGDFIIPDFSLLKKNAPNSERWSWLVHNHMRMHSFETAELDKITAELDKKYTTPGDIVELLITLDHKVKSSRTGYIPLIESWARHNAKIVVDIVKDTKLFDRVPERFKDGFHSVAAKNIEDYISAFAKKLIAMEHVPPLEIDRLTELIIQNTTPPEEFMPWMRELVPKLDENALRVVINRSYFVFRVQKDDKKEQIVDLIELAITKGLSETQLDPLDFVIHQMMKENMAGTRNLSALKQTILETLKNIKRIDYNEDSLLTFVLDGDLKKLLDIVDYRLRENQKRTGDYFDAIPFDGFKAMSDLVKTYSDLELLMDKISMWIDEDLIYSFDIEHLLKPVSGKADEATGNYLTHYITSHLDSEDPTETHKAIAALRALPFGTDTIETYLKVLEKAEKLKIFEKAKTVFVHNVVSGSYSGTIGQAPPALVNKQSTLESMKARCRPGQIKSLVEALAEDVKNDIQSHLNEAAELIDPKS